jgi:hypothetical protein
LDECSIRTHLRPWYGSSGGAKEAAMTLSCDEDEKERVGCKDIIAIELATNNRILKAKRKKKTTLLSQESHRIRLLQPNAVSNCFATVAKQG